MTSKQNVYEVKISDYYSSNTVSKKFKDLKKLKKLIGKDSEEWQKKWDMFEHKFDKWQDNDEKGTKPRSPKFMGLTMNNNSNIIIRRNGKDFLLYGGSMRNNWSKI